MRPGHRWQCLALGLACGLGLLALSQPAGAQSTAPATAATQAAPAAPVRETIEADVSTRSVAIGTAFAGTAVVVFGTIENSRQRTPDEGLYDVAIVIAGPREELIARRKSNVAGLWINASSFTFKNVPSYYSVLSTKPIKDIATKPILWQLGIGFDNMRIVPAAQAGAKEAGEFRDAVLRVKTDEGLYREDPQGVAFIGRSLFRGSVDLPANAPVGEFTAWIYLFEKGELIAAYKTKLDLQRQGFERTVYNFAMSQPLLYGMAAVAMALFAGWIATVIFRRN